MGILRAAEDQGIRSHSGEMVTTMQSKSRHLLLVLATAFIATCLHAATWPSGGCPGTLQACIDAAAPGEVIEIATDGPIAEAPEIHDKSLTLRPAAGFTPLFASPNSIIVIGGDISVVNVVEGMTIANGRLLAVQGGEGTFDVTFRDNVVLDTYSFGAAIEIYSGNTQPPYGPVLFDVANNRITVDGFNAGDQIGAVSVGGFESDANGRIVGNVIVQTGESTQSAALGVYNGAHSLIVDILGNDIGGHGFNNGISLFQFAPGGNVSARIVDNLVRGGQVDVAGQPGGIGLNVSQGDANFIVVNNTIANGETGVLVGGRADLEATISGVFANNIVSGHTGTGLGIDSDFETTFTNDHNLLGSSAGDFFTPGPGTRFGGPGFVGADDFHLAADSLAVNMGENSRVPADVVEDIEGAPRIQSATVDAGAYESPFRSVADIPALNGAGLLLLAFGVGFAALRRLRPELRP